jgi:nucleoside-diphosphate-sugar epimerase
MKLLLTGATGFVGGHLLEKLLKEGHQVFAVVRSPEKLQNQIHANLTLIRGDITETALDWVNLLPENLEACIHSAGIVHSYEDEEFDRVNHLASNELVKKLVARYPQNFKYIFISSLAAAGPCSFDEIKNESSIDLPVSAYGKSKKHAELDLRTLAPTEWTTSIIRPPMVIGPRDSAVLDIFKMVKGGIIILPGTNSKDKLYSFVCVFDLIETISKVLDSSKSHFLYSSHEEVITFNELILKIKKLMRKKWIFFIPIPLFIVRILSKILYFIWKLYPHSVRLTPDKIFELEATSWTCNSEASKSELNQIYRYDLDTTIKVTLEDYERRGWL